MATPVNMPQVGQDLETARINEWHVKVGDKVKEGDILATVESDKASFEVEANADGYITELLFEAGDEAHVFKPIAYIGQKNETLLYNVPETIAPEVDEFSTIKASKSIQVPKSTRKLYISPSARRIARENNISLETLKASATNSRLKKKDIFSLIPGNDKPAKKVTPIARKISEALGINSLEIEGSGFNSRVMKKDVISHLGILKSKVLDPVDGDDVIVFGKTRKRIAERLTFSKQTIPHYYLFSEADISPALKWKDNIFATAGIKVSVNDRIIKATADALLEYPDLNAWVDDEKIIIKPEINIGVAVSTPEGLFVPVIPLANKLNLNEIHEVSRTNAENAKRGIVQLNNPGTFTITNLGMFGANWFLPIINPPECAILSVGTIEKKVVARYEKPVIADIITLGLACDHRAVDGAKAAQFLGRLKEIIENFGK
jgi:pyruvate dehydrogenase E2 component (dihydrolipoamide acetyltransferase)